MSTALYFLLMGTSAVPACSVDVQSDQRAQRSETTAETRPLSFCSDEFLLAMLPIGHVELGP